MANMNLAVTIPASGKIQISTALPQPTGGPGNLTSNIAGQGTIYAQIIVFQNQGSHSMYIGDATTTGAVGGGLQLTPLGSADFSTAINYGTYLSDWWVAGTAGDVCMVLYIQ
jgi:hypothetical protein